MNQESSPETIDPELHSIITSFDSCTSASYKTHTKHEIWEHGSTLQVEKETNYSCLPYNSFCKFESFPISAGREVSVLLPVGRDEITSEIPLIPK